MKLLDVMTSPWAIMPAKLREIRDVYLTHLRGEKIDLKKMRSEFLIAGPKEEDLPYENIGGVAVISVTDVLTKNRSFFSFLFGGTSMRDIGDAFEQAMEDVSVHSVVLSVDSPGGTVDGTEELANRIRLARGVKPIASVGDGLMASAAYWIAAAADRVYIAGNTAEVGSIGVVATHVDVSEQDRKWGEKYTEITAGKYKRIASIHKPLSEEGRAYIQAQVDDIYATFVESVAEFRGRSVEQVLEAADGRIFIGRKAVEAGLVDGMATLGEIINQMQEEYDMNLNDLKEKHPDIYRAAFDEGRVAGIVEGAEQGKEEGMAAGRAEGLLKGAEAERNRIREIESCLIPGHEGLIESMKYDGTKSAEDARKAVIDAEKKIRTEEMDKLKADAIKPAAPAAAPVIDKPNSDLPEEERAKAEWDRDANLRIEFQGSFDRYMAFVRNEEAGRVKIFRRKA